MRSHWKAMQIGSYLRHQHVQDVSADSIDLFAAFHLLWHSGADAAQFPTPDA